MSSRLRPVLFAAAAAALVAGLGGLMTDIGTWYQGLVQPSWKPSDAWFGPVWTLIFALCAVSGVNAWQRAHDKARREWLLVLFALNAFLNVLWSLLFFRLRRPDWALWEVGLLWLSVLALIVVLGRYARQSSVLLVPYILWITFAAALNWAVVRLNGPF